MKKIVQIITMFLTIVSAQNMPVQTWIHTNGEANFNLTGMDAYKMPVYTETWHQFQDGADPNKYHTVGFSSNGSMMYQFTEVTRDEGIHNRSIQYFGTDLTPKPVNTQPFNNASNGLSQGGYDAKANTFNPGNPW
jgi:hypothetical protein